MRYEFKPSFDRSVKVLSNQEKQEIKTICIQLIDILSGEKSLVKGIRLRILFRLQDDLVEFILAGSHDDIKRFLKQR